MSVAIFKWRLPYKGTFHPTQISFELRERTWIDGSGARGSYHPLSLLCRLAKGHDGYYDCEGGVWAREINVVCY